jgi:hypothetical protein
VMRLVIINQAACSGYYASGSMEFSDSWDVKTLKMVLNHKIILNCTYS